jgi:hypothetical protein
VVREGELGAVACASFASTWLSSSLTGGYSWRLLPAHGTRQLLVSKQGFELVYNQFLMESEVFLGGFCNECLQFIGESIWPDLMWQRGRSRRLTSWWCWWCPGGVQVVMMSRSRWLTSDVGVAVTAAEFVLGWNCGKPECLSDGRLALLARTSPCRCQWHPL